jgi:hypothetical protein
LLLIAPVHGMRRPKYRVLSVPKETQTSSHYSESREDQGSFNTATTMDNETRLKNIVKRPSKSLSKVKFDIMMYLW